MFSKRQIQVRNIALMFATLAGISACGSAEDLATINVTTDDAGSDGSGTDAGNNPVGTVDGGTIITDSGSSMVSDVLCSKITGGLYFEYSSASFSDGSRFVSCSVSDSYAAYSNSQFYGPGRTGTATGYCSVGYDVEWNGTGGWWAFTDSGSSVSAVYSDSGSSSNGSSVSFSGSSDCSRGAY